MSELLSLRMQLELLNLRREFNVPIDGTKLPRLAKARRPIIVQGYASVPPIDSERVQVLRWALGVDPSHCSFLLHHDPNRVAGKIRSLRYDDRGLKIEALVTNPDGWDLPDFSVNVKVLDYEIVDRDKPSFYAKVRRARLNEISMTDNPASSGAVVTRRFEAPASNPYFDLMMQKISKLAEVCQHLAKINKGKDVSLCQQ